MKKVITVDLGASNGRLMLVTLHNKRLVLKELHRFSNSPVKRNQRLFWDITYIIDEIKTGLKKYLSRFEEPIDGIGVDTWGVDFGLISSIGNLLEDPISYRDTFSAEFMPIVHQRMDKKTLFNRTGVESTHINTLYQIYTVFKSNPELREQTATILTLPSLINYLLSGEKYNEFTHATTTQLLNWKKQDWDQCIINKIFNNNLPLGEIKKTNTILGELTKELKEDLGINSLPVINVPGHDTACAVSAIPLDNESSAFMSCGTWVLIGVKVTKPVVSADAFKWGFTNEGTAENTFRLQKNNMGLWLLQQCEKEWKDQGEIVLYNEQFNLIKNLTPFTSLINPNNNIFFNPDSMINAIQFYCKKTGQKIPYTKGEIIRCILESLALKNRWVINKLEILIQQIIPSIHMAGGGIQNKLFCQFTANATGKKIKTGPVEASSIGNAISQFVALREFADLQEARNTVKQSFTVREYHPTNTLLWDKAYRRFLSILEKDGDIRG